MKPLKFFKLIGLTFLCSCSLLKTNPEQTPSVAETKTETVASQEKTETTATPVVEETLDVKLSDTELRKYAYELGFDPKSKLTPEEIVQIGKRRRVRRLERRLDSQKERLNYSKIVPWLEGDDEKISYLTIPSIEGRQAWVIKNKIWQRAKSDQSFQEVVDSGDIAKGMPADFVVKAWGEPDSVEHSGNPIYKNERWKYSKQVSTPNGYRPEKRIVYFEGGRVVGWETE